MVKVALLTCSNFPKLSSDDSLLIEPFKQLGAQAIPVPWDDPNINWSDFDICIIRSTWNYHHNLNNFLDWVGQMENQKINLWNPASIVCWNSNKRYLKELKEKNNVPIIQTFWLTQNSQINLTELMDQNQLDEIVIKPTVGASSDDIWSATRKDSLKKQKDLEKMLKKTDILIQPLIPEVQEVGEWSFVFIDQKFSHAVLKTPKKNDFRVQSSFGGTTFEAHPSDSLVIQAEKIIKSLDTPLLYARVDGVEINQKLTLMELELIEPALFFGYDKTSPEKFAAAVMKKIK